MVGPPASNRLRVPSGFGLEVGEGLLGEGLLGEGLLGEGLLGKGLLCVVVLAL